MNTLLDPETEETGELLNKLLLEMGSGATDGSSTTQPQEKSYTTVVPKPGFCIKTKTKDNEKVFINICKADNVPEPKDISETELMELLESDDPTGYRIPMSIGEPHAEVDKNGRGCTAYDIIIHSKFFKKIQTSAVFKTFFLRVMVEAIEGKYNVELSAEYTILKNRKFLGDLLEQNVRKKSKPFIMEMDKNSATNEDVDKKPLIEEVKVPDIKKGPEPKFTIIQEPAEGYPMFLVAEIHLPQVKTAETVSLDLGEDRILLDTRSNIYYLDIYLPYNIVQEESGSQFDRKSKILTITMPVQPQS